MNLLIIVKTINHDWTITFPCYVCIILSESIPGGRFCAFHQETRSNPEVLPDAFVAKDFVVDTEVIQEVLKW